MRINTNRRFIQLDRLHRFNNVNFFLHVCFGNEYAVVAGSAAAAATTTIATLSPFIRDWLVGLPLFSKRFRFSIHQSLHFLESYDSTIAIQVLDRCLFAYFVRLHGYWHTEYTFTNQSKAKKKINIVCVL